MSPESAAIEAAHAPINGAHVQFVTRPALFCGRCGHAVEQRIFGPIRREVWCNNMQCEQHGKRLSVFDPIVDGVPHE